MEIELETRDDSVVTPDYRLDESLSRLTLAAATLEAAAARLNTFHLEAGQSREHHLAAQLAEAEATIKHLQATAQQTSAARKTTAPGALLSREGIALEAGALGGVIDQALTSLSMEQRIAVKAHLLRAGLLA